MSYGPCNLYTHVSMRFPGKTTPPSPAKKKSIALFRDGLLECGRKRGGGGRERVKELFSNCLLNTDRLRIYTGSTSSVSQYPQCSHRALAEQARRLGDNVFWFSKCHCHRLCYLLFDWAIPCTSCISGEQARVDMAHKQRTTTITQYNTDDTP